MYAVRLLITLLIVSTFGANVAAQDDPSAPLVNEDAGFRFVGFSLIHDNDGWITDPFDNDDQHYTAGQRIDVFLQGGPIESIGEWLPLSSTFTNPEYAGGIAVSLGIYTSRDVDQENPPRNERPYAGLLLFHAYVQRFDDKSMDHVELDTGLVGSSSLGQEAQEFFHSARGWDKQLHDEFMIDLTVRKTWKIGLFGTETGREGTQGWGVELLPQVGGTVGTAFRQAHAQMILRAGYNLPGDFGPRRVFDIGSAAPDPSGRRGVYAFVRGHGRGVQHNITLDGNTYRNSRSVAKEEFVGEFEFGFATRLGKHLQLGWSWTALSDEYENDDSNDSYASVSLAAHFEF